MSLGGRLRVSVCEGLALDAGGWAQVTVDGHAKRVITPSAQPLSQQLITFLEGQPVPPRRSFPSVQDEAAALYGLCVRYGSYFAVLADASKPVANHGQGAGIEDDEMMRMNIEISATLAHLIDLLRTDEGRFNRLIAQALAYLPLTRACAPADKYFSNLTFALSNPDAVADIIPIDQLLYSDEAQRRRLEVADNPTRILANALVNGAWRNSEIENQHALPGPCRLRERRLTRQQEAKIRRATISRFRDVRWALIGLMRHRRPWVDAVLPFHIMPLLTPYDWSLTDETCNVSLSGGEDDGL